MEMTSSRRLQEALAHREPDRVPLALMATMHPARDMGLSLREYLSSPEHLVEGQLRLRDKFGNDMLCCYPGAAVEMLAWGGGIVWFEQGPPNAGAPIIRRPEDILELEPPKVADNPPLQNVLEATRRLKAAVGDDIPIGGAIVSPFSLPIMQMGFEQYLELIYQRPDLLRRLLAVNAAYCADWANAQLTAGATAIMYYDPASSPTILPRQIVEQFGLPMIGEMAGRINGGLMVHLASGRGQNLVEDFAALGVVGMSASAEEDLADLKGRTRGRLTLVGNLNALEMRRWGPRQAEDAVKKAIAQAGPGGGFILADNHGEIPLVVDDAVLHAVVQAVKRWGRYPLEWI